MDIQERKFENFDRNSKHFGLTLDTAIGVREHCSVCLAFDSKV